MTKEKDGFLVSAPVIILDDASFQTYCEQIGILPRTDGAVIRNQICDVTNPDFRHPQYMPYIKDSGTTRLIAQTGGAAVDIPILACTEEVPVLREEYATLDKYELVHFLPAGLWKEMEGQTGGAEQDTCIRILCRQGIGLEELETVQGEVEKALRELIR